jgi:hypothetical protein
LTEVIFKVALLIYETFPVLFKSGEEDLQNFAERVV